MKRLINIVLLIFIFMFSTPCFADQQQPQMGVPFTDLNGVQIGEDGFNSLFTIVPISPPYQDDSKSLLSGIKVKESSWQPNWDRVPFSRYLTDCSTKLVSKWWGGFVPIPNIGDIGCAFFNLATNILFTLNKGIVYLTIQIMLAAFHTNFWVVLGAKLAGVARNMWEGTSGVRGLKNTLFLFAISFAGFYYVYKLARMKFNDIFKGILVSIVITSLMLVYIAKTESILNFVSDSTDTLSGAAFGVISFDNNIPTDSVIDKGLIAFANNTWELFVVDPWAYMNFGTTDLSTLTITKEEYDALENIFPEDVKSKLKSDMRVDQVVLGLLPGSQERNDAVGIFQDRQINHGKHNKTVSNLSPGDSVTDFVICGFLLFTTLIFSAFLIFIGVLVLLGGLKILGGVAAAPFVGIVSIIPEYGFNVAYKWSRFILSGFGTKGGYGILLSLVCIVLNVIMSI